jgi:RNA polymerase Rpc34 subunit
MIIVIFKSHINSNFFIYYLFTFLLHHKTPSYFNLYYASFFFISSSLHFLLFLSRLFSSIFYRGVWTRDIKLSTNIPQHTLTKTLKILEQRNLIKSVRSVVSKSKKLYMLYDIVPAKEITGDFIFEFIFLFSLFVVCMASQLQQKKINYSEICHE